MNVVGFEMRNLDELNWPPSPLLSKLYSNSHLQSSHTTHTPTHQFILSHNNVTMYKLIQK